MPSRRRALESVPPEGERRYTAPALEKGLDILELLSVGAAPLTMGEIGAKIGRSKGQIFRNLRILEERGYLARTGPDERYFVTNKLFELGMRTAPVANVVGAALPVMDEVARLLNQSVHLAVASGSEMVVVARVENPGGIGLAARVGHHNSLVLTTSGRVLLAFQPASVQEHWLAQVRAAGVGFDEAALRERVRGIAARGHAVEESRIFTGVVDVGCPILGHDGRALASLTAPIVIVRSDPTLVERAAQVLRAAAARIMAELGWRSAAA